MDDDDAPNSLLAQFVALNNRSLLELRIDLERVAFDKLGTSSVNNPSLDESEILNVSTSGLWKAYVNGWVLARGDCGD